MRILLAVLLVAAGPALKHTSAGNQLARSSLVTAKNLGKGWSGTAGPQQGARFTCTGFAPSGSGIVETGAASSPDFSYGTGPTLIQVLQKASVYATTAQANTYWKRAVTPKLVTCAAQTIEAVSAQGVKVTVTKQEMIPFTTTIPHAALYRVAAKLNKVTAYLDVLVLANGRTITEVTITSFTTAPPAQFEQIIAHDVIGNMGGPAA
jgi:hypothetical protein